MDGMKEKPIILPGGAQMIRAVLEGRKSQFRLPVKLPIKDPNFGCEIAGCELNAIHRETPEVCPFGGPGQRLWVRETWNTFFPWEGVFYKADDHSFGIGDGDDPDHIEQHDLRWRSATNMPRRFSRITLEVVNVRVQRLQEISEAEAQAEGATSRTNCNGYQNLYTGWSMDWDESKPNHEQSLGSAKSAFLSFMNKLHGGKRWNFWYSWPSEYKIPLSEANPYVWAVEFRRV